MQTPTWKVVQVRCDELPRVLEYVKVLKSASNAVYTFCLTFDCVFVIVSPSQGPCCTVQCTFKGTTESCRKDSECAREGMCNGATALCPASQPKENFTFCHSKTQVCINGVWQL